MKSMTGHGISQWKTKDCYIEVIVQSYNSKNLDVRIQSPPFYTSLEGDLKKIINKKISRGVVNIIINRTPLWPVKKSSMQWNKQQALKWKNLYVKMAKYFKIEYKINLLDLAKQPGVLEVVSQPCFISTTEQLKLKTLIKKALDICYAERKREGISIKKDFQKHLKKLLISIKKNKSLWNKQKKRISANIKKKKPLQEEKACTIHKIDINEEIIRLEEHIKVVSRLILSSGVIGKKIAFYLQEMIRESNTIGSKSQDSQLTQEVIQTKTIIERMREQIQNVE